MKFLVSKETFQEKLSSAAYFSLSKTSTIPSLQGALLKINEDKLEIITTNLNDFFYTQIEIKSDEKREIVVDVKKIVEFLTFLPQGKIEIEIHEKNLIIKNNKTEGFFNLIPPADFPSLPKVEGKEIRLNQKLFKENLPLVLFACAKDETRPVLTGVNFLTKEDQDYIVATDGFRMSLFFEKKKEELPSMIVSAGLLSEVNKLIKNKEEEIEMIFSEENKIIQFGLKNKKTLLFSRVVEGEFPPFEKVIPKEWTTRVTLDKEEFLRNIKLISIFARDYSNIVFFEIKKDGFYLRPKIKETGGTVVFQEGKIEGEEQKIAFNYKFILEFLLNVGGKQVFFEMTQPNAPSVFKTNLYDNFIHVIMPIRTEEEVV